MANLGLVLLDLEYEDAFNSSDIYNVYYLIKEANDYSAFLSEVYNIRRFWEVDYFDDFILDKMMWTTIFYQFSEKRFVVVSDSFTERNIYNKLNDFIEIQKEYCGKVSPVISIVTIQDKEICLFLIADDSEEAVFRIKTAKDRFEFRSTNICLFEKLLNVTEKELRFIVESSKNFNILLNELTDKLNLPMDISFEKVRRNQTKLKAIKFKSRRNR